MNKYDVKRSSKNLSVGPLAEAVFIPDNSNEEIKLGMLAEDAVSLKMERTIMEDLDPASGQSVAEFHMGTKITVDFALREVDLFNLHRVLLGSKLAVQNAASPASESFTGNATQKVFVLDNGQVNKDSLVVEIDSVATTAFKLVRGEAGEQDSIEFTSAPANAAAITVEYEYADKKQLRVDEPSYQNLLPGKAGKLKLIPADGSDAVILPRCVLNSPDGELQFGKEAKRSIKVQAKSVKNLSGTTALMIGDEELTADEIY